MPNINKSDHRIYFEHHGNPDGPSILFLHGGPGLGTTDRDLLFFDLKHVNVILYDQRGCGKSKPTCLLENNTTQHLIGDINSILDELRITQIILFGGSWGSSLALLYAIQQPERVTAMILRGIFTCTKEERKHFEEGGVASSYPKIWERYTDQVPEKYKSSPSPFYYHSLLNGTPKEKDHLAFELMLYGMRISQLDEAPLSKLEETARHSDYLTRAIILAHYTEHDFFIEDNYILQNVEKIERIPTLIVQGKNDQITLPRFAKLLSEKMHEAELFLVDGGHGPFDPNIFPALKDAVQKMTTLS